MRAVVVYESMFGNTHVIADHVADGLRSRLDAVVVSVHDASDELIDGADLVVVGGPTHIHGMSSHRSREGAKDLAAKDDALDLEPDAEGPGLRDWFDELAGDRDDVPAAAFDTRVHATALVTGQASKGIAKRLRRHGFDLVVEPESFFVDKENHLEPGEAERAEEWGRLLAAALPLR
ncbi:MAG TPA: flavodoxin domain-containing protein [Ilumatobacteraceae bacterium]|nr:flavodoxin domain-containing protein [Ilumatobacteraceae bacterium]